MFAAPIPYCKIGLMEGFIHIIYYWGRRGSWSTTASKGLPSRMPLSNALLSVNLRISLVSLMVS